MFSDPAFFAVAILAFWFGGAATMSRIAGWHRFNSLYPASRNTQAQELPFSTATLGPVSFPITYRRCVRISISEQGVGLSLMFPFRFHSPGFMVPWAAITDCTETQALSTRRFTFTFAGTERKLVLLGELGQLVSSGRHAAAKSAA